MYIPLSGWRLYANGYMVVILRILPANLAYVWLCLYRYIYVHPNLILFYMDGCPGRLTSCFLAHHMLGSLRGATCNFRIRFG